MKTVVGGWSAEDLDELLDALPSGSRHRGTTSLATIDALLTPVPVAVHRLNPLLLQALEEEPRSKGRSNQGFRLIMLCLEHGFLPEEALDVALRHRPTLSKWDAKDGTVEGVQRVAVEVQRIFGKHDHIGRQCFEVDCPNEGSPQAEVAALRDVLQKLNRAPWSGHQRSLRDILVSQIEKALSEGRTWTAFSERQWASAAGCSQTTLRKHKKDLLRSAAITKRAQPGPHLGYHSDAFTIHAAEVDALIPRRVGGVGGGAGENNTPLRRGLSASTSAAVDDLRRAGVTADGGKGWGKTATDIYLLLDQGKFTANEIADHLGCTVRTVRDALTGKLSGVVVKHGDRWTLKEDVDLSALTGERGVEGRAAKQRATFAAQTRGFRERRNEEQDDWTRRQHVLAKQCVGEQLSRRDQVAQKGGPAR